MLLIFSRQWYIKFQLNYRLKNIVILQYLRRATWQYIDLDIRYDYLTLIRTYSSDVNIYCSRAKHHHHWLDSPWWTLVFLRIFAHSSLLRAIFFQFLILNILISWSTPSSHRSFGLPTLHAPSGLVLNIFLRVLSFSIRTKCPAHASLLTLI